MFLKEDLIKLRNLADIEAITPRDFEWFSKFLFEHLGFASVFVTKKHGELEGDGGIDLTMFQNKEKIYVQCKKWRFGFKDSILPVHVIRELGGCMLRDKVHRGVVITTLEIDPLGEREAQQMNIELIGKLELIKYMVTINPIFNQHKQIGIFRHLLNLLVSIFKFIFLNK